MGKQSMLHVCSGSDTPTTRLVGTDELVVVTDRTVRETIGSTGCMPISSIKERKTLNYQQNSISGFHGLLELT